MNNGNDNSPVIRADAVSRHYADGDVQALDNVSVTVRKGEYVAVMGPSGSGKSTLLNLIGALDRPTQGEVYFDGRPLSKMRDPARLRASRIGYVFQSFLLIPTLTAVENVQIPMFEGPLRAAQRARRARQLLELVRMSHRAKHVPSRLSVGERQRVAIARSLANEPDVVLADEPTGNLDSHNAAEILDLFSRLHREQGVTLVVVTHSEEVAAQADRVIRLRDGKVDGQPGEREGDSLQQDINREEDAAPAPLDPRPVRS